MSHRKESPIRIFLWSSNRSLSSVFSRSIMELPKVKSVFEPHALVFYQGPGKRSMDSDPRKNLLNDTREFDASFKAVDEKLAEPCECDAIMFVKNMAYFVEGRYEDYIQGQFANFKHTFLIRHPKKTIISQYRADKESEFPFTYPGIRQLYELYRVVQQIDPTPLVLDADDLLENPKEMMKLYCFSTGLPFTEDMLTWEPGEIDEWKQFPQYLAWHRTAMYSSGFIKPKPSAPESLSEYPKIVEECIQESLPYYEALYQVRTGLTDYSI